MSENSKKQQLSEESCLLESIPRYQGKFLSFYSHIIKDENQDIHEYDIISHPGAAVMIPIHSDGKIHLVKQWRRAANEILLELPAGTLEKNEAPSLCAQRELQEEIGYKSGKLSYLGGFFTAPGFCNEFLHLFLAENLIESPLIGDDSEKIDHCLLSLEDALDAIDTQLIRDAKTICGIYRYFRLKTSKQKG